MDPDQPLMGLQSLGLDGNNAPLLSISDIAAHYIREIQKVQPDGPYHICGYSFGGSVAYEMACQLEQQGHKVGLLAVIDHATPKSGYYTAKLSLRLFIGIVQNLPYRIADIFIQRPDQFIARLKRKVGLFLKRMTEGRLSNSDLTAEELIDDAAKLQAPTRAVIRANHLALSQYQPQKYTGTLTLLRARGGRLLVNHDPWMGWKQFAREVQVKIIPGSHLNLFRPKHVMELAWQIQKCLDEYHDPDT
jgi:aspartate racemase